MGKRKGVSPRSPTQFYHFPAFPGNGSTPPPARLHTHIFLYCSYSDISAEIESVSPQELYDTAARTADPAGDVNRVGCCHSDQDRAHVESRQDKAPIIITSEDGVFLD